MVSSSGSCRPSRQLSISEGVLKSGLKESCTGSLQLSSVLLTMLAGVTSVPDHSSSTSLALAQSGSGLVVSPTVTVVV